MAKLKKLGLTFFELAIVTTLLVVLVIFFVPAIEAAQEAAARTLSPQCW